VVVRNYGELGRPYTKRYGTITKRLFACDRWGCSVGQAEAASPSPETPKLLWPLEKRPPPQAASRASPDPFFPSQRGNEIVAANCVRARAKMRRFIFKGWCRLLALRMGKNFMDGP
jgi:hypothetical protein